MSALNGVANPYHDAWHDLDQYQVSRKATFGRFLTRIDDRLGDSEYLAGDTFTIADITAFVTLGFAGRIKLGIPEGCPNVARWHGQIATRPSAEA